MLSKLSLCEGSARETWHNYRRHLLLHNDRVSLLAFQHLEVSCYKGISLNFGKFCNKDNWPRCLVVFSIVILLFSAIRSLLSDLSLSEFPLVREVKATQSILKWLLLEAKKKTESMPAATIPPKNHTRGLRAPFHLNFKPNIPLYSARYKALYF